MNHRIVLASLTILMAAMAVTGIELNGTLSTTHRQAKSGFRMDKSLDLSGSSPKPMATTTNEISQFLNTKNIVKTLVKLVFGTNEESTATSRQVLNLLVKVLDMLKTNFHQRNGRSRTDERGLRDSIDDAAVAGISMMKGFIRSVMATDDQQCIQRHICDAAAQATRESRELGSVIAQMGSYVSSYVLDNQKSMPFKTTYEAGRVGRSNGEMCHKMYRCMEPEPEK